MNLGMSSSVLARWLSEITITGKLIFQPEKGRQRYQNSRLLLVDIDHMCEIRKENLHFYLFLQALTDLLAKAEADQEALAAARYLTESERKNRVDEIATERKAWRMDAVRDAMQAIPDDLQTEVT